MRLMIAPVGRFSDRVFSHQCASLAAPLQEQLHESEENFAKMLQDEHSRLESCESQFLAAMREAEAQLAHAALAEEHLMNELRLAQKVQNPPQSFVEPSSYFLRFPAFVLLSLRNVSVL